MKKKTFLVFLIVSAYLLWSTKGHVSQIGYQYINLEELVERSSFILIVSKGKPEWTEEKVLIDKEGKLPPYVRYRHHFLVLEVLHNKNDLLDVKNKNISVLDADDKSQYEMHQEYYSLGLSISPVFEAYKPGVTPDQLGEPFLIFLNVDEKGQLKFATQFAFESFKEKKRVMKLIKKK